MEVANENVIDPVKIRLEFHKLHLRSLTTINEEMSVLYFYKLARGKSSIGWQCTA
jgi:hypothetical protein